MSNDLLNEEFFNNPNIPDCEKLGIISLLGCGSFDQRMDSTGRESTFVSMCPKAGGGTQFIAFTYGRPESLNKMSVKTILHSIGFNGNFIDEMFTSMNDKEVIDETLKFFRVSRNTDKSKEPNIFEMIEPKLNLCTEKYRITDAYLTEHPQILMNLKELAKDSFGASKDLDDSKKKQ